MITATAQALSGSIFSGWTGDITSSSSTISFTLGTSMVIDANFSTASAGGGGNGEDGGSDEEDTGGNECAPGVPACSPILIDLARDGFDLTDSRSGASFDIDADGDLDPISWTTAGDDDSFLWLDENGNGVVDDGAELFGTARHSNGFIKLASFDQSVAGGNGDGRIDDADAVWSLLAVWTDTNHDGRSDAMEVQPLTRTTVTAIELSYQTVGVRDRHGNLFKYKAAIRHRNQPTAASKAFDVFFVRAR